MRTGVGPAVTFLKALGNEHRLMVLCQLHDGEKSVSELEALIGLSQSALSQHLARLRQKGLVQTRRESQTIYYSLAGSETTQIIGVLADLFCEPPADPPPANPKP
jgi:DNA-binding transcriptional ArsR family regulator